ncbi:M48 family metallopeptidase [Streptomyces sp. NPDC001922]|uniref:M48 family metallopeptidase n=1 Tax=Streptomyces sp. NPDC001922 TaxID=3364624 RepID=UPI003689E13E
MTAGLRAALALGLLVGFYALVTVLVVLDLTLILVPIVDGPADGEQRFTGGARSLVLALGSVPVLLALRRGVAMVSRSAPVAARAVRIGPERAPELWEMVRDVARRVGVRPPDALFLTPEPNAAVAEDGPMLGLRAGARRLYVGVPLLMCLTRDQLRAVLGHEFGHCARHHTRFGALTHRCATATATALDRLRHQPGARNGYSFLVGGVLRLYARVFDRLTFAVRRRQELEADSAAAALAGRAVTAEALRAAHGAGVAWRRFTDEWLVPAAARGMRPDDPFRAFRALLDETPSSAAPLGALGGSPGRRWGRGPGPGRRDAHPPLVTRLRRLARLPVPVGHDTGSPAGDLLPAAAEAVVVRVGGGSGAEARMPWRAWLRAEAGRRPATRADALLRAAVRTGGGSADTEASLGTVLRLLAEGRRNALAAEFAACCAEATGRPAPAGGLREGLRALVGRTVVSGGRAYWRAAWGGDGALVCPGLSEATLRDLLSEALAQPSDQQRLLLHLAELGVDPGRPDTARPREATPGERSPARAGGGSTVPSSGPGRERPTASDTGVPEPAPASLQIVPLVDQEEVAEGRRIRTLTLAVGGALLAAILVAVVLAPGEEPYRPPAGVRCGIEAGELSCPGSGSGYGTGSGSNSGPGFGSGTSSGPGYGSGSASGSEYGSRGAGAGSGYGTASGSEYGSGSVYGSGFAGASTGGAR